MSSHSNIDGPEQRTAFHEERARQPELEPFPAEPPLTDAERIADLKGLLADIATGADMMLQPALKITGSMRGYIQEVKRVASAGRDL